MTSSESGIFTMLFHHLFRIISHKHIVIHHGSPPTFLHRSFASTNAQMRCHLGVSNWVHNASKLEITSQSLHDPSAEQSTQDFHPRQARAWRQCAGFDRGGAG